MSGPLSVKLNAVSILQRVVQQDRARAQYGDLVDRLSPYLLQTDPDADRAILELSSLEPARRHEVIGEALLSLNKTVLSVESNQEALIALVDSAKRVPPWLDWERVNRAGRIFWRAGLLGGLTLGLRCLVYGYAAPAGNKPLALSGALTKMADRRLAETGRFITAVCRPEQMRPGGEGFAMTVRVRLMHAQVRALVARRSDWQEQWGAPINQHDMLATILLFSCVFVDGIRMLGVRVSRQEADDFQHLFRWVGAVIGVAPELLPADYDEASRLAEYVRLTQGPPDEDARELVEALLAGPLRAAKSDEQRRAAERHVAVVRGLCRGLLDQETADGLGLPKDGFARLLPGVKATFSVLEALRRRVSWLDPFVESLGERYWDFSVMNGLQDEPAQFRLPERLWGKLKL